jgi:hypothetical protein
VAYAAEKAAHLILFLAAKGKKEYYHFDKSIRSRQQSDIK